MFPTLITSISQSAIFLAAFAVLVVLVVAFAPLARPAVLVLVFIMLYLNRLNLNLSAI